MREMAATLLALADEEDRARTDISIHNHPGEGGTVMPKLRTVAGDPVYIGRLAEAMISLRRLRDKHLDETLFGEPGWEMLLDLYVQRVKGRRVSVTSVCTASCAPTATALRWLAIIQKRGWVTREGDPTDNRRSFIALSRSGEVAVTRYLTDTARYIRLFRPLPFMLVERVGT